MGLPNATDGSTYHRRVLILLGLVLGFRLVYAALIPVNPAGDEAYYWDWGRQLDYGYYSKPPLIAWLYAFVDWIGGGSLFAIRAMAAVLGTSSVYFLFRLVDELFDARTAWTAVILALIAPANSVLSYFLTIDAPLVVCWTAALWALWRYISGSGKWGALSALFFALAIGHLTKQMMMVFPVLAIVFMALGKRARGFLKDPALMATLVASYLSLIPPLLWNIRNDWITAKHTSHHFEVGSDGGNFILERMEDFLSFLATQLGVLSPLVAVIVFSVSLVGLKSIRTAPANIRFLLVFGALPLAGMLLLALRQGLQPNWPAVFYVSGIALTAAWWNRMINLSFPPSRWRNYLRSGIVVGLILVSYFYFGSIIFNAAGKAGHKADPNRRLMGHDELAAEFQSVREKIPGSDRMFLLTIGHRDLASHLAFGLPDQPRLYRWENPGEIHSQYELWNNPFEDGFEGKHGIILAPGEGPIPPRLAKAFKKVEKVEAFDVDYGYDQTRSFTVHVGRELKKWPTEAKNDQ